MKRSSLVLPFAPLVLSLVLPSNAAAEASSQEKAMASRLFDDAGQLMSSGNATDACPKYAESQRLDPQLGTLIHLADCYAKVGKTASAWGSFKDAAEIAHNRKDPREAKVRERIEALEKSLSNLVIAVADTSPDLEVREDGALVGRALWGLPVPIDGGSHTITASAPGKKTWTGAVRVGADGTTVRIDVPALEADAAAAPGATAPPASNTGVAAPAPPAADSSPTPNTTSAPAASERRSSRNVQSLAGWSMVGAGVVGLGVGAVFALKHSSKLSDRDAVCPTGVCPQSELATDQAKIAQLTSDARSAATVATIGFVAGGALAAGGLALVLTAHRHGEEIAVTPLLGPRLSGVSVSGSIW